MTWNEYQIKLCFDDYVVSGIGYGETKQQALRLWRGNLDFDTSGIIESIVTKTAVMEDN